jgi:hypothetical protein
MTERLHAPSAAAAAAAAMEAPPCDSGEGGILGDLKAVRLHARMIY